MIGALWILSLIVAFVAGYLVRRNNPSDSIHL